jgi:hypothetical protein
MLTFLQYHAAFAQAQLRSARATFTQRGAGKTHLVRNHQLFNKGLEEAPPLSRDLNYITIHNHTNKYETII